MADRFTRVHYTIALDIEQFKDEPPKNVSKKKCMVIYLYDLYVFAWIQQGGLLAMLQFLFWIPEIVL